LTFSLSVTVPEIFTNLLAENTWRNLKEIIILQDFLEHQELANACHHGNGGTAVRNTHVFHPAKNSN
jgi:hypothetical protein